MTFSLFLFLGWFRFVRPEILPITVATIFYLGVSDLLLPAGLDRRLVQLPFTLILLMVSDWVAKQSLRPVLLGIPGDIRAGLGLPARRPFIEGRRPALADNILQVFNAPLFLTIEVLAALKMRKDLYESDALNYSHGPS